MDPGTPQRAMAWRPTYMGRAWCQRTAERPGDRPSWRLNERPRGPLPEPPAGLPHEQSLAGRGIADEYLAAGSAGVREEAMPGLTTEQAGVDHAQQQRRRRKQGLL